MSTKEAQLKLERTTVVLRGTHWNYSYALPPDNVEPAVSKDKVDGGELFWNPDVSANSSSLNGQHTQNMNQTSSSSSIQAHQDENDNHKYQVRPVKKKRSSRAILRCDECTYESLQPEVLEKHRQLHVNKSSHQCTICSYSVKSFPRLKGHFENHHTQQEKDQASPIEKPSSLILKCDECLYESYSQQALDKHRQLHVKKSEHQCDSCSYSVSVPHFLAHHMKNQHANLDPVVSDTFSGEDDIPLSKRVKRHHGNQGPITLTDAFLVLDEPPNEPGFIDEEEKSYKEQLNRLEEALQSDRRSLEKSSNQLMELEEKKKSLRQRVETAKKNEKIADQMIIDLLINKKEVKEQKRETSIKKLRIELELRTEQRNAIELDLIEPDAVGEDHQERVASVQKKVQSLEQQLGEIENELAELAEEDEAITEDLEDADERCVGATRLLSTIKTELEQFETALKADGNSLNEMIDSLKGRIRVYHSLEERRLKIELVKKKENLWKKKMNVLLYLKKQFDNY